MEFVVAYIRLGNSYLAIQQYLLARTTYQDSLQLAEQADNVDISVQQANIAALLHQLGIVAEALKECEEARSHYQQALDIYIEYKDRYEQAGTFNGLGVLAKRPKKI